MLFCILYYIILYLLLLLLLFSFLFFLFSLFSFSFSPMPFPTTPPTLSLLSIPPTWDPYPLILFSFLFLLHLIFPFGLFLVFTLTHFAILLVEYGFMTRGALNFMEKKWDLKSCKWSIELVVRLFGYTFYFSLLFGFIFIGFCKYLFVYIYSLCTELNIEQTKNFI